MIGSLAIVREHSPGDQAEFCFDADMRVLGSVANLIGLRLRVRRLGTGDGANDSPTRGVPAIQAAYPLVDTGKATAGTAVC